MLDARPDLIGRRRLLHRHQPDRPGRRHRARHRGVQRAVLQHPLGRGAGDRRHHRDGPPADRARQGAARRGVGQVGGRQPRDPRTHARHRRLRQHRLAAVGGRRDARHAGLLLRHRGQARARQRPAVLLARGAPRHRRDGDPARRRPRSATPASSAPSSSPGCARARCSSTSRAASSSTTTRCADASSPATSPARRSTSSRPSRRSQGDPFDSPLRGLPNVILTPARRRLDRGGAGGHRPLRRRQAARLRRAPAARPCR